MHSLVDGIIATGSGAFQAGAPPAPKSSQLVSRREPSIEEIDRTQSMGSTTPHTPPEQAIVGPFSLQGIPPILISVQIDDEDTNKSEVEIPLKKRQRSFNIPEPTRPRKHRRQEQTQSLITGMTQAVQNLCSSLQPAPIPPQSPQRRRTAAIKLMEKDGDFKKSECIPVIRLFVLSMDVVDSYLAIEDQEVRTMYIKDSLT